MKPLVKFLLLMPVAAGGIGSVGWLVSIGLGVSLGLSVFFVSLVSILVGVLPLLGGKNKTDEIYDVANVVTDRGFVQVFPELQPGRNDQNRTANTPSGLPSQTRIERARSSWLTTSLNGLALSASGTIILATVVIFGLA